jgi:hypothetical protein
VTARPDIEITPEPSPSERAAIEAAVAAMATEEPTRPSAWWRAGVVDADDEPDGP